MKKIKLGYVTHDNDGNAWIPYRNTDGTVSIVRLDMFYKYPLYGNDKIIKYGSMHEMRMRCNHNVKEIMDNTDQTCGKVKHFYSGVLYINLKEHGFYTLIETENGEELFPIRSLSKHAESNVRYTDLNGLQDSFMEVE